MRLRSRTAALILAWVAATGCGPGQEWKGEVVGRFESPMDASEPRLRTQPMPLGALITGAMLERARVDHPRVALAFLNAGSISYDQVRVRDGVYPAGLVRSDTIEEMLPFDNTLVVLELPGGVLRATLELGRAHTGSGGFLQTSTNVVRERRPDATSTHARWRIDGVTLSDDATYQVVTVGFLAEGGDGYSALTAFDGVRVSTLREAVMDHGRRLVANEAPRRIAEALSRTD